MTGPKTEMEAVLSCGDVVTTWDPARDGESVHWTVCTHPLCHGSRRVVKEIRPQADR